MDKNFFAAHKKNPRRIVEDFFCCGVDGLQDDVRHNEADAAAAYDAD